ncbi:hypothetical protein KKP91_00470 [Methanothermococcus sp. SCGC AD-155-M21]|nr:hypothetical protein [Methanothermococcus sp. SCGC AD-155-M21]
MKFKYIILFTLFFSIFLNDNYALDSVVVKLNPDYIKTHGDPVYFNISLENIPPRKSLGMPSIYSDSEIRDGGCLGADIYVNYPNEYLGSIGFNWSDEFKEVKLKEYKFENGTFYLSISFDSPVEGNICLGTLTFSPIKKGRTTLNLSGVVSSECGMAYSSKSRYYIDYGKASQSIGYYPDTEYCGATVVIEGGGNYTNHSTKLEETLNESDILSSSKEASKESSTYVPSNIINKITNNITISTNQSIPKVIVKEINLSERPNITVIINTSEVLDYRLLIYTFLGSLLSGVLFGVIMRLMRIV